MKYLLILLGFIVISHVCCEESIKDKENISTVISIENATAIENWPEDLYNYSTYNVFHSKDKYGFGKRIVGRIKRGIKFFRRETNFNSGKIKLGGRYRRLNSYIRGGYFSNNPNTKWIWFGLVIVIAAILAFVFFYCRAKRATEEVLKKTWV